MTRIREPKSSPSFPILSLNENDKVPRYKNLLILYSQKPQDILVHIPVLIIIYLYVGYNYIFIVDGIMFFFSVLGKRYETINFSSD